MKDHLLRALERDWGGYVFRVKRLSPEERAAFLSAQGYVRLADLLAHVIAWWKEGYRALESMLRDPNYQTPDYDVDVFNAIAVESAGFVEETDVIEAFDAMREVFYQRIAGLPDEAFQDTRIVARLKVEIIGHYADHAIS
jgi:hypothetical protein